MLEVRIYLKDKRRYFTKDTTKISNYLPHSIFLLKEKRKQLRYYHLKLKPLTKIANIQI